MDFTADILAGTEATDNLMHIAIILMAIFGLQHLITQSSGPFNWLGQFRNWLFLRKSCGPFFLDLFSCPYCAGIYSAALICGVRWLFPALGNLVCFILAGGVACLFLDAALNRLYKS